MYEREVITLLEGQVVFVATVNGIAPQVRPMQAQVDADGVLWLYCSACRRADEIAVNDRAALCVMADDGSLLRMNGQLEAVADPAGASSGAVYRLRIHSLLFNSSDGDLYTKIEQPLDLNGVLLLEEE